MLLLIVTLGLVGLLGASLVSSPSQGSGSLAGPAISPAWEILEEEAVQTCPGLPWEVVGALGWLVSRSGRLSASTGAPWSPTLANFFGLTSAVSPERPMTALLADAVVTLCVESARAHSVEGGLLAVVRVPKWVVVINVVATALAANPHISAIDATAVTFAAGALGLPYQWGGNGPLSYDCSGLVVAAFRSAGVSLPRTAQAQHDVATLSTTNGTPGQLVFFGASASSVTHVGIEIGGGLMIDAPETGLNVRIESDQWSDRLLEGSVG